MPPVLRLIDANANRAREALRVMEDAARFLLDDRTLSEQLKQARHDLAAALAALPDLPPHRDTDRDVGTKITTGSEMARPSAAAVVVAAGKRLSEALRAIEEYSKTLPTPTPDAATVPARMEALRYRGYTLEKTLTQRLPGGRGCQWSLCLLLTRSLCVRPWREVLEAAMEGGVDCVQVREKEAEAGELLKMARDVVAMARPRGVAVVVNDRPDVAMLAGADGVHLGQTDLPVSEVRRLVGGQLTVGVSTSELEEATAAEADGADYCGVGPMFATTTKHKPELAGPAYLRQYLEHIRLPHLAIGGIRPDNLAELVEAGVRGIAVSSAICAADDPQAVAVRMAAAMRAAPQDSAE